MRAILMLHCFFIVVCMVYVQAMYCPAVNDQFMGYNYGNTESDIGSSFRALK